MEGDPDVTYDYYYNASWQMVEVRKDSVTDPYEQFVWDARYIDAPVVRFRDGNTDGDLEDEGDDTLYYCNDANMNVTALVDGSDGTVVERVVYDPYGKPKFYDGSWANPSDTSAFDNAILYCGYFFDDESGLYSVRRRPYNFAIGCWLSRDPIGYVDGTNLFEYGRGRPTKMVDAVGMKCGDCCPPEDPADNFYEIEAVGPTLTTPNADPDYYGVWKSGFKTVADALNAFDKIPGPVKPPIGTPPDVKGYGSAVERLNQRYQTEGGGCSLWVRIKWKSCEPCDPFWEGGIGLLWIWWYGLEGKSYDWVQNVSDDTNAPRKWYQCMVGSGKGQQGIGAARGIGVYDNPDEAMRHLEACAEAAVLQFRADIRSKMRRR